MSETEPQPGDKIMAWIDHMLGTQPATLLRYQGTRTARVQLDATGDKLTISRESVKPRRTPVDKALFARTAPQWNCVDYPDGPHYVPGAGSCLWCGMTIEQIAAEPRHPAC